MKLTLAEPKYLKESIGIISELVTDAKFKITPNGIELIAMDPANVAMVIFKLLSSCFVEYELKENKEICINLNNLKQILRRAKPTEAITLKIGKENKLEVVLKSNTIRTFSIPLIELEEKEQKVPELAFPVIVETTSAMLSEAIEDVGVVSESVSMICEPTKMTIKGEGDSSQAKVEIDADKETKISNENPTPVKAKYSIEYLKKMIQGSKLTNNVTILFDQDYPLKLDFKETDKMLLSFILAPRVENS